MDKLEPSVTMISETNRPVLLVWNYMETQVSKDTQVVMPANTMISG
jgi:hypothetical protein